MRALYENGYKIPDDISIIGFDDISVASFSNPPLTTIHTPAEFMGEYAAHYILLRTKEDSLEQQTPIRLTLPCNLVVRNSCAAPVSYTHLMTSPVKNLTIYTGANWLLYNLAYAPFFAKSSSCVPCSKICPFSITSITSAF